MKLKNLLLLVLVMLCAVAQAQDPSQMPIPVDTGVRIGKLQNGLTYYIRHNNYPEHVANFYIAQRVGSIQEQPSQRGLAHFLEHMAFNGSEHFKDNGIIDYTRSLGVSFGGDLNAYTDVNETVYRVCNVPSKRVTALDSCLLILKDWSHGLTLDGKEIDKERGVIHGEWTMGNGAGQRLRDQAFSAIFPNSKYATCDPIGLMSIVDKFPYDTLRAYYKKWYRPDNQALVIVGDVDVNHVESQIQKLFGGIVVPKNAAKVVNAETPDNTTAIYSIFKDKEQKTNDISIDMKFDATPDSLRGNLMYLLQGYMENLVSSMFNSRLEEMQQNSDSPFTAANVGIGSYCGIAKTKDSFSASCTAKDGKDLEALSVLMKEIQRVRQNGFTGSEYVRAREELLSQLEKAYDNRNKMKNDEYAQQYIRNFEDAEPIPSIETEYQLAKMILPNIPVESINELAKELISDKDTNLVVLEFAQDKDGVQLPTADQMRDAVNKARAEKLQPWVDNVKNEPLISQMPKKGSIKKEVQNTALGYKMLTLSNGAKVILKKTDFKDDEIRFRGEALGGKNLFTDADAANLDMFGAAINGSGRGNFSSTELEKALAGKQVATSFGLNVTRRVISGNSTPKDIETLMQLIYLDFTKIAKDQKSYNDIMEQTRLQLKNARLNPQYIFVDTLTQLMYKGNKMFMLTHSEDLDKVNYDRILDMAKQLYSNAGDFTFYFIGNIDENVLRPLIEQYIASLPAKGKKMKSKDITSIFSGNMVVDFKHKMESPKPLEAEMFNGTADYTLDNIVKADAAGEVLSMDLLKTVREDASATYTIGADCQFNLMGAQPKVVLQVFSPITEAAKVDTALLLINQVMEKDSKLMTPESVIKVKDVMLKQADVDAKTNGYWMGVLTDYMNYNIDTHTNYKKTIESLTPESISEFYNKAVYKSGNHIHMVMRPE